MNTFERYIPASIPKRLGAALANLMCCALVATICKNTIENESKQSVVALSIWILLAIAACLLPESLGKRFCNIRVLAENKERIERKTRFIRATPYFVLLLSWLGGFGVSENETLRFAFGILNLLAIIFILANSLSVLFSTSKLSLLDMKLKTQVMTPAPLLDSLKPTFFGLKIR